MAIAAAICEPPEPFFVHAMQTMTLGTSSLSASRLAYGCWRLNGAPELRAAGKQAVVAAFEAGYTIFDHADIYGRGEAEKIFGEVLREVSGHARAHPDCDQGRSAPCR